MFSNIRLLLSKMQYSSDITKNSKNSAKFSNFCFLLSKLPHFLLQGFFQLFYDFPINSDFRKVYVQKQTLNFALIGTVYIPQGGHLVPFNEWSLFGLVTFISPFFKEPSILYLGTRKSIPVIKTIFLSIYKT